MSSARRLVYSSWIFFCSILLLFATSSIVTAAVLTSISLNLSNTDANASGVTQTIQFTTASTDNYKQITLQYSTLINGSTKPAHLNLGSASLTSLTGLDSSWILDVGNSSSGILKLTRSSAVTVPSGTTITATIADITNSAIDDCQPEDNGLQDQCFLNISTVNSSNSTVDTGNASYTVFEDPSLTFAVAGVSSGATHNGITTSISTTATGIPFGILDPDQVAYGAQKLTPTTNAPGGYTIQVYLADLLTGSYAGGKIDPFGAPDATWSTPQDWQTPNGTTPNENTGWFGANTSDTRVPNWTSGTSGKFGPISVIPKTVAYSTGPDRSGTDVYVTYVLGINHLQPADSYRGTLVYTVQPNY